jgi:hypothetical protein
VSSGNQTIDRVAEHYASNPMPTVTSKLGGAYFSLPGQEAPSIFETAFKYFNAELYGNRKRLLPLRVNAGPFNDGSDCQYYWNIFVTFIGFDGDEGGSQAEFDRLAVVMQSLPDHRPEPMPSAEEREAWRREMAGEPAAVPTLVEPDAKYAPMAFDAAAEFEAVSEPEYIPVDITPQIRTGAERAKGKAEVNKRVVELGEELAGAQAAIRELQQRTAAAQTFEDVFAQIDAMAGQAFDRQRASAQAAAQAHEQAQQALARNLTALGSAVLGAARNGYEGALAAGAQRRVAGHQAAGVRLDRVLLTPAQSITPAARQRMRALLSAKPIIGALPPPDAQRLLPPPAKRGRP